MTEAYKQFHADAIRQSALPLRSAPSFLFVFSTQIHIKKICSIADVVNCCSGAYSGDGYGFIGLLVAFASWNDVYAPKVS